jgi:hypothetical protein
MIFKKIHLTNFLFIGFLSQKFHNTIFGKSPNMHYNYISKNHPLKISKSLKKRLIPILVIIIVIKM